VRIRRYGRVGFTPRAERINGRIAMAAITIASILSWQQGDFLNVVMEGRMPFEWF